MATQAATNDEELLIITEDADSQNGIPEINIEQDESSMGGELISFEEIKEETENMSAETKNSDMSVQENAAKDQTIDLKEDGELNLDFDLGDDKSELTVEEMFGDTGSESESKDELIDLGDFRDESDAMKIEETTKGEVNSSEGEDIDIFDFNLDGESTDNEKNNDLVISEDEESIGEGGLLNLSLDEKEVTGIDKAFNISSDEEVSEGEDGTLNISLDDEADVLVDGNEDQSSYNSLEKLGEGEDANESILDISLEDDSDAQTDSLTGETLLGGGLGALASTQQGGVTGGDDDDGDDVNGILDATIEKLIKRKEQIEEVKAQTVEQIAALNEEIKGLQKEVKDHKGDVKDFDKETSKIEENIAGLEKMKMPV